MKMVNCPNCNKPVNWQKEALWKPFCSERCKLIDLGNWAAENHRIVGESASQDHDDSSAEFH